MKRGYYSFLLLASAYLLTFFLPFLVNDRALIVRYEGRYYFPALKNYLDDAFGIGGRSIHLSEVFNQLDDQGRPRQGEADYRKLKEQFAEQSNGNWVLLPPMPYHHSESFLDLEGSPPHPPSSAHWLGTDTGARDVLTRLAYGFRVSMNFALIVVGISYTIGIFVGAVLGYFGRWVDIVGQRFVEIWGAVPFLYTIIIIGALIGKSFTMLVCVLASFGWMAITYYIRGEFYREKAKDYVAAAIANGEGNLSIMIRHILPNALTPVITFAPFAIVSSIVALVSLDFLGYGLPPPTPSWGEMVRQAKQNMSNLDDMWHLVVFPLGSMFVTLQLIVFIGEAVREAFDPKVVSRLR